METNPAANNISREYATVDTSNKEDIILQYVPLIRRILSCVAVRLPSHFHSEELVSSGVVGLMDAIAKYNPALGTSFKTYATFRIKGAILDELRSLDRFPRFIRKRLNRLENTCAYLEQQLGRSPTDEELAAALNVDLEQFHEILAQVSAVLPASVYDLGMDRLGEERSLLECIANGEKDPAETVESQQLYEALGRAIAELPEKERIVISLYYREELTMREIGKIMNRTESRVSQIHTKAVLRLRVKLRGLWNH